MIPSCLLERPADLAAATVCVTSRVMAQMKAASSRAIAVATTVLISCPSAIAPGTARRAGHCAFQAISRTRTRGGRNLRLLLLADTRRMAIAHAASTSSAARPAVAGLGDRPALDAFAGRSLRRHEAQICHQLARALEARQIADLRQDRDGRDEIDAAHRHERRHYLGQRPVRHRRTDRLLQPLDALAAPGAPPAATPRSRGAAPDARTSDWQAKSMCALVHVVLVPG